MTEAIIYDSLSGNTEYLAKEIKSIKKSLRSIIKNLSKAEASYINDNENKELRSTFGDLVDICGGDSAKALQIHNSLIASYIARNKAKN